MRRGIVFISYCLIAIIFVFLETSCLSKANTGQFIFVNNSNELITHAKIEICKQVIEFNNIKPHEKFNGIFKVTSDSHYKAIISFASGKKLRDEFGYVTNGFDFRHTITVTDSSISISDTKVE